MSEEKLKLSFSEIGKRGGAATRERYGAAHFARIGRAGGLMTKKRHGSAHFARIGNRGVGAANGKAAEGAEG